MTNIEKSKNSIYQKGFGWTYVGEEMAKKHNLEISSFARRMKDRGECRCPRAKRWFCDQDCVACPYHTRANDDQIAHGITMKTDRPAHKVVAMCEMDAPVTDSDGETVTIGETIASDEDQPDMLIEMMEQHEALKNALELLDEDDRKILLMVYVNCMTDSEIAERLGVKARMTIYRRKQKALRELEKKMKIYF